MLYNKLYLAQKWRLNKDPLKEAMCVTEIKSWNGFRYYATTLILILAIVALVFTPVVYATAVSKVTLYGFSGYPGDVIEIPIELTGDLPERTGYWEAFYTKFEGDEEEKMDITSWITIEPKNYTLKLNETKEFMITITIPKDAEPGLHGVNSTDAPTPGHWYQRRTWIRFKDTDASLVVGAGGVAAWTGFRIPVSVQVLEKPSAPGALGPIITAIKENTTPILLAVILILIGIVVVIMLKRRKK